MVDEADSFSSNNPRRLDASDESVEYLLNLNLQLKENAIDFSDPEAVETLVGNVLSEIKSRCASLASDRRTSFIVEKLVLLANLPQLLEFCEKFNTYELFLARNRYSSHVLQVYIVSILCSIFLNISFFSFVVNIFTSLSFTQDGRHLRILG